MQKIAVIGSGLNGLAVAFGLAVRGISVKIFEEKSFGGNFNEDFRTSFISHYTMKFLNEFANEIACESGLIKEIYSFKNEGSPIVELESDNLGYVVDNALLKKLMIEWLRNKVEIAENVIIESVESNRGGASVNGEKFSLVVCASGANSSIHKSLGLKQTINDYNQVAFIFDIKHEKSHQNIALEIFDDSGIIALLPKKEDNVSSVVLSLKESIAKQIDNELVLQFLQAKTQRARNIGIIEEIVTPVCKYPLAAKYMRHQSIENIFFIGDAFHTIHPVLGQGFNMSVKDIIVFCNAMEEAQRLGIPFERASRSLPKKNIVNHVKMGLATHFFAKAFISESKILQKITSGSILFGSLLPTRLKTKILNKML